MTHLKLSTARPRESSATDQDFVALQRRGWRRRAGAAVARISRSLFPRVFAGLEADGPAARRGSVNRSSAIVSTATSALLAGAGADIEFTRPMDGQCAAAQRTAEDDLVFP